MCVNASHQYAQIDEHRPEILHARRKGGSSDQHTHLASSVKKMTNDDENAKAKD
jgi:hypothetical protein